MDEGRTFPLPVTQSWAWEARVEPPPVLNGGDTVGGGRPTFLTIVTPDRAAQARIFARSVRQCHPDAILAVLVPVTTAPRMFADLFDIVIPVEELALAGLADMRFRYSVAELCYALKPWAIRHLFDRYPGAPVFYFDSDIELFTPLAEVEAALARGANLVLTPHILQPGLDQDREKALLRSGSFNAGFLAIAPSPPARAFVAWWSDRVRTGCTHDPLEGTYGDQKWLELAPAILEGVAVLRHPGYNFAYWNAHERPLTCLGGVWTAAGWPLRFMHYSRWDLHEQDAGQYLAGFFQRDYEPFADLFVEYRQKVRDESGEPTANGASEAFCTPSGELVPRLVREAYARHGSAIDGDMTAVFAHAVGVLDAANPVRADLADLPITVLYDEIWRHHADLRYRFDIERRNGRLAFLRWLVEDGAAELGLPPVFLKRARSAVERERVRELEAGDGRPARSPADSAPASPQPATAAETVAVLVAARDAERERVRRQDDDIRLLVSSNKELRREVQSLRVRHWRDEEHILALEGELTRTMQARDTAAHRSRELADELARLHSRPWQPLLERLRGQPRSAVASLGRQVLAGTGAFFERGFVLGEAAEIVGAAVRRRRDAPSGMLVYGPYVEVAAGAYAAAIEARLYRHLPVWGEFRLDVVRDGAQQVVALRNFRLYAMQGWRRFELRFYVLDGETSPDLEVRIWARKGTPLEIRAIDLYRMSDEPSSDPASAR
jgi:hypothetical protein